MYSTGYYSCQISMTLEFSREIFEKCFHIKFHEILRSESRAVSCGLTDRHDETNSRFSQFCESTHKLLTPTNSLLFSQREITFFKD